MKKNFFIIVLIFVAVAAFPSQIFESGVGVNISYNNLFEVESVSDLDIENIILGLETRTKLFFLEFGIAGSVAQTEDNALHVSGMATAGFTYDFFNVFRVGAGIGPHFDYFNDGSSQQLLIGGEEIPSGGFSEALKTSPFYFKFSVDFLTGDVLRFGATYVTPTSFVLNELDLNKVFPTSENFEDGLLSFVILMRLF